MFGSGNIDTSEGFASNCDTRGDAVACNGNGVGVAQINALEPEVENVGVDDGDVVAIVVATRAHGVVTAIEQAAVECDEVVVVAQKHDVGIGRGSRCCFGAQGAVWKVMKSDCSIFATLAKMLLPEPEE